MLDSTDRVAELDLASGRVTLHSLARRTLAKGLNGPERSARWLGNGLIALTGSNEFVRGTTVGADPAGLELVNVRDWTTRVVDPDASAMVVAGATLLAFAPGQSAVLRAYDFAGARRFELDNLGADDWIQVSGNRAYVGRQVLELPSGRAVGRTSAAPRVTVLPTDGSQFPL